MLSIFPLKSISKEYDMFILASVDINNLLWLSTYQNPCPFSRPFNTGLNTWSYS
uniref:Uncharacterized protein n=1 Tax=Populus trichocarpa TaxID=3694 RepID=A0A2K1XFK3_POPTR